jgi:protocatechuate 3,4-dioxygenase beta subunit
MKRRMIVLGGTAAVGAAAAGSFFLPARGQVVAGRGFDWKGSDFISGGTKSAPSSLPAPVFRAQPNCITTGCKTLGPCHLDGVGRRADISEGFPGLPVRVSLRIVDAANCAPIPGAEIELWHTNAGGYYSGKDTPSMCTLDNSEAVASTAFRGSRVTNAEGRADFLTVYPGWYGGRTVHIHMRALVGSQELLVSQLLFDDALSDLIFADHPDYAGRGERKTKNGNDGVFDASEVSQYIFDVEKADGVLQATYTIGVDRSRSC